MVNKIKDIDENRKKYNIKNYVINKDGSIDVNVNVVLWHKNLIKLPLKFNIINGICCLDHNNLTSLKESPVYVKGDFDCSNNYLTSLKFAPKEVKGSFS